VRSRGAAFLGLGLLLATAGGTCEEHAPVLSSDVSTRDMRLVFQVTATVDSTEVEMRIDGPGGLVRLTEGDRLQFLPEGSDVPVPLERDARGIHAADVPAALGAVRLELERAPPGESVRLEVVLPAATTLTAPPGFSRSEELVVEWEPEAVPHANRLTLAGECFRPVSRQLDGDPGRHVFVPADFEKATSATCPVTVTLFRTRFIQLQSLMQSASGQGVREARIVVESTP